jgi:hypothetical protein
MEFILRFFVASWYYPMSPIRTVRQSDEGWGVAHFVPDGLAMYGDRMTGNQPTPGAPVGLIIGDSFVVADEVDDDETMGAEVENLSRAAGKPVNVHQYGWYETGPATYIANAGPLRKRWNPSWSAIFLDYGSLGLTALSSMRYWVMRVNPDLSIQLIDLRPPPPTGWREELREFLARFRLLLLLNRRATQLKWSGVEPWRRKAEKSATIDPELVRQRTQLPYAVVRALKQAYGSRVLIIYDPGCGVDCDSTADPRETALLEACTNERILCESSRSAMIADRDKYHRLSQGFSNTLPGEGHLNVTGHRIVGELIWQMVESHPEVFGPTN